jgi:hypothetical protein
MLGSYFHQLQDEMMAKLSITYQNREMLGSQVELIYFHQLQDEILSMLGYQVELRYLHQLQDVMLKIRYLKRWVVG